MELEEIISSIMSLDFEGVIRRESREYLINGYKFISYQDKDDDKKFITNGLKRFINKNDKIIFLLEAINYLNEEKAGAASNLDISIVENYSWETGHNMWEREQYSYHLGMLNRTKKCEAQIFYAVRELEKLGLNGLDKSAFSNVQVNDLTRKLNALLIKIDELTVGQEIIYNFIDELKTDLKELKNEFPLGKKRWYQRFSGIVASYLGNKGADALYDIIKPDIMKIIQDVAIDKLLN
jgi:hypothetical protein